MRYKPANHYIVNYVLHNQLRYYVPQDVHSYKHVKAYEVRKAIECVHKQIPSAVVTSVDIVF